VNILVGILKYPPDYAGDGLRLHRTFQRLRKKSQLEDVYVLTSWDRAAPQKNEVVDGICILRDVECTLKRDFRSFSKKIALLRQIAGMIRSFFEIAPRVDLVLTSGSGWFPSLVAWLAFFARKPVVKEIVLLGSDDPRTLQAAKPFPLRWFFTQPFRFAKLIIAISPPLEKACLNWGLPQDKIWCRLNPIDIEFPVQPEIADSPEPPLILWVGTVSARKNVHFLLKAAAHFKEPVRIWFVGPCADGDYFLGLQQLQVRLPRHIEVRFTGEIKDMPRLCRLYSRARLFWFASRSEGMGNVVAESLICGTPVVTLPVMDIMKHLLPHAEDGEVVDTEDPEVFASAAASWLKKKIDRAGIAARARERFSAERVDAGYAAWFRKLSHSPLPEKAYGRGAILIPERISS